MKKFPMALTALLKNDTIFSQVTDATGLSTNSGAIIVGLIVAVAIIAAIMIVAAAYVVFKRTHA